MKDGCALGMPGPCEHGECHDVAGSEAEQSASPEKR